MGNTRMENHARITSVTETIKIDREKLRRFAEAVGHSETSLSRAYGNSTFIGKRFNLYGGTFSREFTEWCANTFPRNRKQLHECIVPEEEPVPEPQKEEQLSILPAVMKDRVVTIQPVSLVGINQVVEALNDIAEKLRRLEEAWNGHRE